MKNEISIRKAKKSDYVSIIEIYNHYIQSTAATFDCHPYTVHQKQDWFEQFDTIGSYRLYVAENLSQKVVGYIASTPFNERQAYRTSANISFYCDALYVGKGVGSLLLSVLMADLKDAELHKLYGGVTLPNDASIGLLQKYGFTEEGILKEVGYKFNRFWDVMWLGKPLSHPDDNKD